MPAGRRLANIRRFDTVRDLMDESSREELDLIVAEQSRLRAELRELDLRIDRLRPAMNRPRERKIEPPPLKPLPEANPPPPPALPPQPLPSETVEPRSFEMQLGTVWLVRIGIVVMLTGIVFLGNYAWQNIIAKIGPLGKIVCLYLAGLAMAGLGAWIERGRETLRNYARVLTAGGLATIYYTTYAAHFVPRLRVIESPLIAGTLLLALAAAIVWLADRKKSETLAIFALLLSYYTAAINPLTGFSLFSNLLLTAAAVFFIVRHRWVTLTFAALAASYFSYAYWQFFHGTELFVRTVLTRHDFWIGTFSAGGYWTLFTAAVFLCRDDRLFRARRLAFLSFNNAAFFALVTAMLVQVFPGKFWIFALSFGAVLLALAALANRRLRDDPWTGGGYLAQGLILVSAGTMAKATGYQLALILSVESAILIACGRQRHGWIFRAIAAWCAFAGCASALRECNVHPHLALPLGLAVTLIFLFDARWLKHLSANDRWFDPRAAWFVALALVSGAAVMRHEVSLANHAPALAAAAMLAAFLAPLHGLGELALLGQSYLAFALYESAPGWWRPLIILAAAVSMNDWWLRQKSLPISEFARLGIRLAYIVAALWIFLPWTSGYIADRWQFLFLNGVALALFLWAILTKNWLRLAVAGLLALIGAWNFLFGAMHAWPDLAAIFILLAAQQIGKRFAPSAEQFSALAQNAMIGTGVLCLWVYVTRAVGRGEWIFYTTVAWSALGGAVLAGGFVLRERVYRYAGLLILGCALGRIVFIDVWQLETLSRAVSFIVLAVVLLALGFAYNKFAARLREWL